MPGLAFGRSISASAPPPAWTAVFAIDDWTLVAYRALAHHRNVPGLRRDPWLLACARWGRARLDHALQERFVSVECASDGSRRGRASVASRRARERGRAGSAPALAWSRSLSLVVRRFHVPDSPP